MRFAPRALGWIAALSLALNAAGAIAWTARHVRRRPPRPEIASREQARAALFHALAGPAAHRDVVLLGDSLTERGEWWELLDRPAANRGIANDTIAGVRARLDDVVALAPRLVFVLIGVNDLMAGATPEAMAADHAALIAELRRRLPGARLVVESLLPIRDELVADDEPLTTQAVRRANQLLARGATAAGAEWLDVGARLADPGGELDPALSSDGLHLSAAGYRAWADALRPYLVP
ncbi:MAG TPA: GDSL-type esterase/lipase family protein [Kofleriaceae bacterium]|nr:GDSL-type esterase/lipase family protein [Kofleriaceae bacterium]